MLYVTMKWFALTWKIISSAKQISVLLQMFKTFLPLRWLFLLIILKANSGRKVLYVYQMISFFSWEQGKTAFPNPLASRKRLMSTFDQRNINRKHWPQVLAPKIFWGFCANTCSLLLSPLVICRFEAENNGRLQCPRVWQCHHVSNILSECSLLLFSSWDAVVIIAVSTYTHTEWKKNGVAIATIVRYRLLDFNTFPLTFLKICHPSYF